MNIKEKLLFSIGIAVIAFSLFLTYGFLISIFEGDTKNSFFTNLSLEISEGGTLVYSFPSTLSEEEKSDIEDI